MWCINCQIETNNDVCPVCKQKTIEDVPTDVLWCHECKIPVQQAVNQSDYKICPICHSKMKHLSTDLRPVFPEERLLVELLLEKNRMNGYKNQCGHLIADIMLMANLYLLRVRFFKQLMLTI